MSVRLCPHCGKSRDGMSDQQPCWNCGRLPYTSQPRASQEFRPPPYMKRFIPRWLACTGTLGILLFIGLVGLALFLFLTAEETSPEEAESPAQSENALFTALPTNTVGSGEGIFPTAGGTLAPPASNTPAPVAVGPFAETAVAIQPNSVTPTSEASLLPTPSLAPTFTTEPTLSPTPLNCPGAPPTRLTLNTQAEVTSQNTVRVRNEPSLQSSVLLNASNGEIVTIIEGPVCVDSFIWWKVQFVSGASGWMAEGNTSQYFLRPL